MKLNQDELVFLTGVTKGAEPFGLFLKYPGKDRIEDYKKEVLSSLQEKGILDQEQKFTREGTALLLLWEAYRGCKKHLILNHLYLAVCPNRRVIGIGKQGEDYELFSTDSAVVLTALLKKYEFLRTDGTKEHHLPKKLPCEKLPYGDWVKELEDCQENLLILGDYREKTPRQEDVYYWKENKGYRYDPGNGYRREISSRSMRLQFLNYLEITKE